MGALVEFVKETITSPRGLPPGPGEVELGERVAALDDRMRTLEALTWTVVPAAGAVGLTSLVSLVRAGPDTPTASLVARGTVVSWSLIAIAMAKLWHAQDQKHTALMKELFRTQELLAERWGVDEGPG